MEDTQIIDLYFARNEAAITETDRKYRGLLFKLSMNVLNSHEDSEECLNDTYLRTWNSIPPTRPSVFSAFLTKIVRGFAIDKLRKNTAKKRGDSQYFVSLDELEDCVAGRDNIVEEMEKKELGAAISRFLRGIKKEDRGIFVRRYYYMESVKDVAAFYDMKEATVATKLKRTREKLREYLLSEKFIEA